MPISKSKAIELLNKKIGEFQEMSRNATFENRYDANYNLVYHGTQELIASIFSREDAERFRRNVTGIAFAILGAPVNRAREVAEYREHLERCIAQLHVYLDKVDITMESDAPATISSGQKENALVGKDVFIVYGHDRGARFEVAHHLETNLKLHAIMLDQDNAASSPSIAEEVERQAESAGYAVVLLTPDDTGGLREPDAPLQSRARQNVILELGYFWGKLGRKRLCILKRDSLEIPSDFSGIQYVEMDSTGAWRGKLQAKLHAAGMLQSEKSV